MKAESVLTPSRQAELEDIATCLAEFQHTASLSKRAPTGLITSVEKFAGFTKEKLKSEPDERGQMPIVSLPVWVKRRSTGTMNRATRSTISR